MPPDVLDPIEMSDETPDEAPESFGKAYSQSQSETQVARAVEEALSPFAALAKVDRKMAVEAFRRVGVALTGVDPYLARYAAGTVSRVEAKLRNVLLDEGVLAPSGGGLDAIADTVSHAVRDEHARWKRLALQCRRLGVLSPEAEPTEDAIREALEALVRRLQPEGETSPITQATLRQNLANIGGRNRLLHFRKMLDALSFKNLPLGDEYPSGEYPGLHHRYDVHRVDGKADPEDVAYFVLNYSDPWAQEALLAYAIACQPENPYLARDIAENLSRYVGEAGIEDESND